MVYWVVGLLWDKMFENHGHRVHVTNGWCVTSPDRRAMEGLEDRV